MLTIEIKSTVWADVVEVQNTILDAFDSRAVVIKTWEGREDGLWLYGVVLDVAREDDLEDDLQLFDGPPLDNLGD